MSQISGKVAELLAKHPTLSQEEAIKIVSEKNARKNKKRSEKANKGLAKKLNKASEAPEDDEA